MPGLDQKNSGISAWSSSAMRSARASNAPRAAMSLLDIEREYEVDEADITEEIDLDLLAPADDGYDAEYA